jgi:hypothetical protein
VEILQDSKPYNKLKTVESLLEQVDSEYSKILGYKKQEALLKVDGFIEQVKTKVESVKSSPDLSNKALKPIQDIKKQLEIESSVPQVAYHLQESEVAFEQALDLINELISTPNGVPPQKIENVKLSSLTTTVIFETEQQVNDFINRLRDTLLEKIRKNNKVRVS